MLYLNVAINIVINFTINEKTYLVINLILYHYNAEYFNFPNVYYPKFIFLTICSLI